MFSCCFGECPNFPSIEDNGVSYINTNNKKYIVTSTKNKLHIDNNDIFDRLYLPKEYKDLYKFNFIE